IEQVGYDFYKTMAHNATNVQLREGYNQLAEEEKKHIDNFERLRDSIEKIDTSRIDNWDEVSLYFKALIDTKVLPTSPEKNTLVQEFKDEIGAIHISISFEKDTILFLQELNRWVNPEDQKLIEKLIEEEKSHVLKLLQMKKQIVQ
ncbi:MAG: ferritin family protein, partial [bacterium]